MGGVLGRAESERAERFSPKPNPGVTKIEIGGRTQGRVGARMCDGAAGRRRILSVRVPCVALRSLVCASLPLLARLPSYLTRFLPL